MFPARALGISVELQEGKGHRLCTKLLLTQSETTLPP